MKKVKEGYLFRELLGNKAISHWVTGNSSSLPFRSMAPPQVDADFEAQLAADLDELRALSRAKAMCLAGWGWLVSLRFMDQADISLCMICVHNGMIRGIASLLENFGRNS